MKRQTQDASAPLPGAMVGRPFVDALLDPRTAFASPDVIADHPWLSREEKRLILWSWARDVLRDAHEGVAKPDPSAAVLSALTRFDPAAADEFEGAFAAVAADREGGRAQH